LLLLTDYEKDDKEFKACEVSNFGDSVGVPVTKEDNIKTATLPFAAKRTTGDGLLSKLNLTKCEAAVIMPPVLERPIGHIDGRVADRTKRSNSMTTDERETSTAPILHLNFKVGEEARLVSRCSKGRAPPSTQSASMLTEDPQYLRRGTSHDCIGNDDGNYDVCISWNTSTSTIISFLLCAVGFFASLTVLVGGYALLKIGSKTEQTGRSVAKRVGKLGRLCKCLLGLSVLVSLAAAEEVGAGDSVQEERTKLEARQAGGGLGLLNRKLEEINVDNMSNIFNTVSSYGNTKMANGDIAILADGSYKCSEGTCGHNDRMLWTNNLNGEVKCVEDNASCVLNGENERRGMFVDGTGSGTLILRALTFDNGSAEYGGGVLISNGALVDFELLVFSNNRATSFSLGGGAIYVATSGGTINAYGTSFNGNSADSWNGDDIYNYAGTITIHNTCPSPYSSKTPTQGKKRMRIV
jgi:predicted outer membrane repeat protein